MLYDIVKSSWVSKNSIINVYLITKNKPDFNQLAGRINIDLSTVCENNPYSKPLTESLTYSSTSADLKFSLSMKYILQSKKTLDEIDLLDFRYLFHNTQLTFVFCKTTGQLEQIKVFRTA